MIRYETLLLARSEATEDDLAMIEKHLDKLVGDAQGKFSSFDRWGKYKLAFSINKNTHGIYILARYDLPSATNLITEFDRFLKIKCTEIVMRHVTVKLKPHAPTTYHRPEALDVARSGSIDSFLKESKIENLLSSVEGNNRNHDDNHMDDEGK